MFSPSFSLSISPYVLCFVGVCCFLTSCFFLPSFLVVYVYTHTQEFILLLVEKQIQPCIIYTFIVKKLQETFTFCYVTSGECVCVCRHTRTTYRTDIFDVNLPHLICSLSSSSTARKTAELANFPKGLLNAAGSFTAILYKHTQQQWQNINVNVRFSTPFKVYRKI